MDWNTMGELGLSVMIFAPGLVLLAVFGFVGLLMLLEKSGAFSKMAEAGPQTTTRVETGDNPQPGRLVEALKRDVGTGESDGEVRKIGNGTTR